MLESYVDSEDGLWCLFGDVWTVEGDCHVPMGSNEAHRIACDFAMEARLLSELYVANVWKTKVVAYDTAGIVTKLEGDSLGPLVLLRVLCFVLEEVLETFVEVPESLCNRNSGSLVRPFGFLDCPLSGYVNPAWFLLRGISLPVFVHLAPLLESPIVRITSAASSLH